MPQGNNAGGGSMTQAAAATDDPYAVAAAFAIDMSLAGGREEVIDAQNNYNTAIAEINNRLREKSNETAAAWESTKAWQKSVNNNIRLQTAGEQVTATNVNAIRQRDVRSLSDVQQRIALAEQRGAAYSSQAASGVAGTVGDMVNSTIALRAAMTQEQLGRNVNSQALDVAQRTSDIMRAAVSSLDYTYSATEFDYGKDFATLTEKPSLFAQVAQIAGVDGMYKGTEATVDGSKRLWNWANSSNGESVGFSTNQDAGFSNTYNGNYLG